MTALLVSAAALAGTALGLLLDAVLTARFLPAEEPARRRPAAWAGLATGVTYGLLAYRLGADRALPAFLYLGAVGVVLARIDLVVHRLPNKLTLPSYGVGLLLLGIAAMAGSGGHRLLAALGGMAGLFVLYLLLALVYPAGLGFGDVKLAGVLGLYAGWLGLGAWLVTAVGGWLVGGAAGLVLLAAGRVGRKAHIAFGPAMLVATLVAVVAGAGILRAYAGDGS